MRALCGLDQSRGGTDGNKQGCQDPKARRGACEAGAGQSKKDDAGHQDRAPPEAIRQRARRVGHQGVGRVVGGVEQHGDRSGTVVRTAGRVQKLGGSKDQQRGREVPETVETDAGQQPTEWPGTPCKREHALRPRRRGGPGRPGCFGNQRKDGGGGEEAGQNAEGEEPPITDGHDERRRRQGTGNGTERVHGSLHAEGTAELLGSNRRRQEGVTGGRLAAPRHPGDRPRSRDNGPGCRQAERAVAGGSEHIAAGGEHFAFDAGAVGHNTTGHLGGGQGGVGNTLDHPQGGGRSPETTEKAGERCCRHLMAGVREQAAQADPKDAPVAQNMVRSPGRARTIAGSHSGRIAPPAARQSSGRAGGAAGSLRSTNTTGPCRPACRPSVTPT